TACLRTILHIEVEGIEQVLALKSRYCPRVHPPEQSPRIPAPPSSTEDSRSLADARLEAAEIGEELLWGGTVSYNGPTTQQDWRNAHQVVHQAERFDGHSIRSEQTIGAADGLGADAFGVVRRDV